MARRFIKDSRGKDVRNSKGQRLFWSDNDGDWNRNRQTVYREHSGFFGGSSKIKSRYNPSRGKFKK
jgi:hypothetical protein